MPDVKTAAEVEANIKRMVGLQGDVQNPPQHKQQSDAGEMSAFKKFVSNLNSFCFVCFFLFCMSFLFRNLGRHVPRQ